MHWPKNIRAPAGLNPAAQVSIIDANIVDSASMVECRIVASY
jgi:hypothetical protein